MVLRAFNAGHNLLYFAINVLTERCSLHVCAYQALMDKAKALILSSVLNLVHTRLALRYMHDCFINT
jgi:hypothetical protein